jgi:hypothetical protein
MRKLLGGTCLCVLAFSGPAQAELIDLGNGMIYDTVQDLTWLQDAAYVMTTGYEGVDAERQRLDGDPALDGLFVWGLGSVAV